MLKIRKAPTPVAKIENKTKCDQVAEEMLSKILKGEYKQNEILPPESYFVDYFGVSRVTIRESFKKLNTLGVITIRQGKGTVVNGATLGTLIKPLYSAIVFDEYNARQIYDVRIILESGSAELAAVNSTEEAAEALRQLAIEMDEACAKRDSMSFSRLDTQFHAMIVEMAQNEVLKAMYQTIGDVINGYIEAVNLSLEVIEKSAKSHHKICDAITAHNGREAHKYMEEHIEIVKQEIIKKIEAGLLPSYLK